ncbi:acyl-CoA Delta(11) desaturase [Diachasma alloeum]|uniref:acyl-CoA Delta(11) desaturase n=1 Tax=Diachasma alloeum TaxID=454923 RepID=UPI0007383FA3|nr:acyl-CoA Delta(11) desaturase [Diachasma alloeum]XP_015116986.1 acyl-CoA Delta(11) desaturase [Diachasma alloeum]XP_015116987.1 acyl-CoA Delta(11) desaturase [Diachasma alloeum]
MVRNHRKDDVSGKYTDYNGTDEGDIEHKHAPGWLNFKTKVAWGNVIAFAIWHCITLYSLLTFPYLQYKGLVLWAIILYYFNMLSITAGVHRLWSHRTYKARLPLRIFLAVCYYSAGQNKIAQWVRDHRIHHKYTDTDADPHSINRGFFFSHIGWQMMKKHPDVVKRGLDVDMSDVENDPAIAFLERHFAFFKVLLCFVLPVGIPVIFFNQELWAAIITQWFMRYPAELHATFSINSFAHSIGYRSYDKSILPVENGFISLFAVGEGWHNYHHVFPWDYKAAELPSVPFNQATMWINIWARMGLAYDLKEANPEMVKRVVMKRGDGSHPVYSLETVGDGKDSGEEQSHELER